MMSIRWHVRLAMKVPHDGFRMWYWRFIATPLRLIPFAAGLWRRRKIYASMGIDWWRDGVKPHIIYVMKGSA